VTLAVAYPSGAICGLALDHRDSLRVAARARDFPEDKVSLRSLKTELARGLAPEASVVLLDTELGIDAMAELDRTSLVIPLESQGYETVGKGRLTTLLSDVDPERAAGLGAVGCKLLLPYRPDLADAARKQEETAAAVIASCVAAGMLSIIEPLVYGEVPALGAKVVETAKRLARLGPDLLKLQYPGDAYYCGRLTDACGAVPWVLLGGGTNEDTFLMQLREACAAGARGYIVGRTAWDTALVTDVEARERAIAARAAFLVRCRSVVEATP
jgi:sulfofructosephosphate aldolase